MLWDDRFYPVQTFFAVSIQGGEAEGSAFPDTLRLLPSIITDTRHKPRRGTHVFQGRRAVSACPVGDAPNHMQGFLLVFCREFAECGDHAGQAVVISEKPCQGQAQHFGDIPAGGDVRRMNVFFIPVMRVLAANSSKPALIPSFFWDRPFCLRASFSRILKIFLYGILFRLILTLPYLAR